jgi:Ca-activated chloride channel homolog
MSLRSLLLLVLLLLPAGYAAGQDDEDDVIAVDSAIVLVNVAVTDANGVAATGLAQKQFSVLEDGVQQEISYFSAEETPFAAVILLDTSGSMESRVSLARSAAITFMNGMRRSDSVAVVKFDSKAEVVQDFSNTGYLPDRFYDLKAYGMTVLNDAVYKAAQMLADRPEKRRAIIVLSDGEDTLSSKSAKAAMNAAIAVNATIYTVDMAPLPGPSSKPRNVTIGALKDFAEKTGGTFVSSPGGPSMREAFKRVVEELGSQYTLAYSPSSKKNDGKFRRIEVRVAKPNLTIRTRKGYTPPKNKK